MGQADGRTPYRFIDPAPHTVNNIARPYKVAGWAVSDVFYALDAAAAAAADYPVRMRQRTVGDTHQRNVAEQQ